MKFAIAALLGLTQATLLNQSDLDMERSWFAHIDEHGLSYGTKEEYEFRKALFQQTYKEVEEWNADSTNTHKLTTNFMSTWTADERKRLNGYKAEWKTERNETELDIEADASVNWVTKGAVTPVKNQEQCGSCWAFSTTGGMEGAHFVASGKLVSLSEQQFVDCDTKEDQGCNGGLMDYAFTYAEGTAIMTESEYPYEARRHIFFKKCDKAATEGVVKVKTYTDVPAKNVDAMKKALTQQPVSIAIEADKSVFQLYHSGVLTSKSCGTQLDHGVLAVGYGTENGQDYFLVKNSWGDSWGQAGYVKLGTNNVCGMLQQGSYPSTD